MKKICLIVVSALMLHHNSMHGASMVRPLLTTQSMASNLTKTAPSLFSRIATFSSQYKITAFLGFTALAGATICSIVKAVQWAMRPSDEVIFERSGQHYQDAISKYQAMVKVLTDNYGKTQSAVSSVTSIPETVLAPLATTTHTQNFQEYVKQLDNTIKTLDKDRELTFARTKALAHKNLSLNSSMHIRFDQLNGYIGELQDLRAIMHYYAADFGHIAIHQEAFNNHQQIAALHDEIFKLVLLNQENPETVLQVCAQTLCAPIATYIKQLKEHSESLKHDITRIQNIRYIINTGRLPQLPAALDLLVQSLVATKDQIDQLHSFFSTHQVYFELHNAYQTCQEHAKNAKQHLVPGGTAYPHAQYAADLDHASSTLNHYLSRTVCYQQLHAQALGLSSIISTFSRDIKASPIHAKELRKHGTADRERDRLNELREKTQAEKEKAREKKRLADAKEHENRITQATLLVQRDLLAAQETANRLKQEDLQRSSYGSSSQRALSRY